MLCCAHLILHLDASYHTHRTRWGSDNCILKIGRHTDNPLPHGDQYYLHLWTVWTVILESIFFQVLTVEELILSTSKLKKIYENPNRYLWKLRGCLRVSTVGGQINEHRYVKKKIQWNIEPPPILKPVKNEPWLIQNQNSLLFIKFILLLLKWIL